MKTRQTTPPRSAPAQGRTAKTTRTARSPANVVSNGDGRAAGPTRIDPAERRKLIERAAYLRAAGRNFAPGGELQDWLEAEAEVERLLGSS